MKKKHFFIKKKYPNYFGDLKCLFAHEFGLNPLKRWRLSWKPNSENMILGENSMFQKHQTDTYDYGIRVLLWGRVAFIERFIYLLSKPPFHVMIHSENPCPKSDKNVKLFNDEGRHLLIYKPRTWNFGLNSPLIQKYLQNPCSISTKNCETFE